jgi:preprotein translocase subunit SecF
LLGACENGYFVVAQTDHVGSDLITACSAIEDAYVAVLRANNAGANISILMDRLNEATALLTQAKNAYQIGDNARADELSKAVLPIANEVIENAQTEQESAAASTLNTLFFTLLYTVISIVIFITILLFVWVRFKRAYSLSKPRQNHYELD